VIPALNRVPIPDQNLGLIPDPNLDRILDPALILGRNPDRIRGQNRGLSPAPNRDQILGLITPTALDTQTVFRAMPTAFPGTLTSGQVRM
jgi:hypothetical protein